ncbi:MAG: S24 family peptidase [Bacteroidota bacterium]
MKQQLKSTFGKNLKFLREKYHLTQSRLAEEICGEESEDKMQKKIGSYEQGHAFPPPDTMFHILRRFDLKYEHLLNLDLTALTDREWGMIHQPEGNQLHILAISVDKEGRENIEFVPEKAAAGYARGFSSESYIRQLDKFHLPWLPKEFTYRAFEISGDSMLPILSGTIVVGQFVEDLQHITQGERYILVTTEGILFKRLYPLPHQKDKSSVLVVSDNPIYPPYEMPAENILEAWKFYAHISRVDD